MPNGQLVTSPRETLDGELDSHGTSADRDATFEELYERYYGQLVRLLGAFCAPGQPHEDFAQEAFLRVLSRLDLYDRRRPLWPWLKSIALNIARDHYRRHSWDDLSAHPEPNLRDFSDEVHLSLMVSAALEELPPRQRAAVTLCHFAGYRPASAASVMNIGTPALEQLLHRGRASLRLQLVDTGIVRALPGAVERPAK